jgi:hypothetical protein
MAGVSPYPSGGIWVLELLWSSSSSSSSCFCEYTNSYNPKKTFQFFVHHFSKHLFFIIIPFFLTNRIPNRQNRSLLWRK